MIGTLYSTNITPDAETGIGNWSDDEFVRALHEGVGKGGKHLYPAFPYTSYALMTRSDVLAIKAYLFSLKPIKYTPPPNTISFPFNQRYLMLFWNALFKPAHRFQPNTDQSADWNRGAYLVEALGHCGDCHTSRNILFGLNNHRKFAGATLQGWKAYNITPDPAWGIGSWSGEQLQGYLSGGHADGRGSAGGPMAEVVDNSLNFLSDTDILAMVTYIKSWHPLPPRSTQSMRLLLGSFRIEVCKYSKEPAGVAMGSTVRVSSRLMLRSWAGEPLTTPPALTPRRLS
jgi:mono/diheme cytochrome c family protein